VKGEEIAERSILSGKQDGFRQSLDAATRLTMLTIEIERESDERWLGELPELPGVVSYGATKAEARTNTIALAFRVIGERIAHGEPVPINVEDYFVGA
jgi:predicted RNase H-like HicB family nuclease